MSKISYFFVCLIFLYACTSGKHQDNLERLDGYYGECDNPQRVMSGRKYKECLAKERAGGESLFDLEADFDKLLGRNSGTVIYQNSVNPQLWQASLEVTKKYPLKIADNQGGFIETDWIYDSNDNQQRCLIKIQVLSSELITTGVKTNFICETKKIENWTPNNKEYLQESNQITLKILEVAGNLNNT